MTLRQYFRVSRKLGLTARSEAILIILLVTAAAFEGVGIGMLLPIVGYIQNAGDVSILAQESGLWRRLIQVFEYFGIPITLGALIATSFVSIFLRQCFFYARQIYNIRLRESLTRNACNLGFLRYLEADTAYHDREASGGVVNSLTTELRLAIDAILSPIGIFSYAFMMAFYVGLLLLLTGPVTFAVMAILGLVLFAQKSLLSKTLKTGKQYADANEKMSTFLVQRLGSARLVRLSGTEDAEIADMRILTERQRASAVHMKTYIARAEVLMEPLAIGIGFIMIYFGTVYFSISIEEIGLFALVAMMRLLPALKAVVQTVQGFLAYLGSLSSFERRLDDMASAREHHGGDHHFDNLTDAIRFDNVGFHYDNNNGVSALHAVSMTIPANRMTALVGPSGAGKSTLVDLLPRLRDPTEGTITIDGRELRDLSVGSLRAGISYVSQSPVIFNVPVAQHIRYGKRDATDAEVRNAAVLAGADEFIEALPAGYDTTLGEDGVRLSGGQRQRLDLARALVRRAPILILDEPTSNLDAEAEERFRDALDRIRRETAVTIIVVAHRLSTIASSDQIVTLENGHVTETGAHTDLVKVGGWYAKAYAQQILATDIRKGERQTATG